MTLTGFNTAQANTSFTMPVNNVTLTAKWRERAEDGCAAQVTQDGGTRNYVTLEDAWTAAQSATTATVTLLTDASTGGLTMSGGDITLNCGGHTLTGTGDSVIEVTGGNLTVENGTMANANGYVLDGAGAYSLTVRTNAVLKVPGSSSAIRMSGDREQKGGTVKVYGTIQGAASCRGIHLHCGTLEVYKGATISCNGDSYCSGILVASSVSPKTVKLYGGTFNSGRGDPSGSIEE